MSEFFAAMPPALQFVLILLGLFLLYLIYTLIHYNKAKKQLMEMQNSLKEGDIILTQSGLYGKLKSINKSVAWLQLNGDLTIVIDRFSIKGIANGEEKEVAEQVQRTGKGKA